MRIRGFQAGDEIAQVSIYNEAASALPKFKPATIDEVRRRLRGADPDGEARFYAVVNDRPVAYVVAQPNGRVSFPWCRAGHEVAREPLFRHALDDLKRRGHATAHAAYRADWPDVGAFFLSHGFAQAREMLNYIMDLVEMPTPAARMSSNVTPVTPADIPAIAELGRGVLRVTDHARLEKWLLHNPLFSANSLFALRRRSDGPPVAVGLVVADESYADPNPLDPNTPCFRLGAFGTEEMYLKRIKGVFSFLAADDRDVTAHGIDLLSYASNKVGVTDIATFAAAVPSDAPHLVRFYRSVFRRQGGFPVYERAL